MYPLNMMTLYQAFAGIYVVSVSIETSTDAPACYNTRNNIYCCLCAEEWICTENNFCPNSPTITPMPITTTAIPPTTTTALTSYILISLAMPIGCFVLWILWTKVPTFRTVISNLAANVRLFRRRGYVEVEQHELVGRSTTVRCER